MNMDPSGTDPDIALEIALLNLEVDSSDSEAEETEATEIETERSEGPPGKLLENEGERSSELTRERMARMYSPSPAPSNAPSAISDGASSQLRQQQPVTLDTIIEDGGLFNLFRLFLKDQCTTRNLNFWLACEHYRKLKPSDHKGNQHLYELAIALYVKFIKASAMQRVTLLDQTKKQIKMGLELKQRVTPDLFLTAQKEIWGVMNKNELGQFLVSGVLADCPGFANLADSVSSFCTDDNEPRSSYVIQASRPFASQRNAISDCEDPKPFSDHNPKGYKHHSAYVARNKPVTEERFAALVHDRLAAVVKDREAMTKKVRERAGQQKKNHEEVVVLEWYDLPEATKYVQYEEPSAIGTEAYRLQMPATSPPSTPHNYLNGLALREVQAALKDMEIINQVNESPKVRLVTPSLDRVAAYVNRQNSLIAQTSERERKARAAALSLIHASPQSEWLSHRSSERRSRRVPHIPVYSDNDESHHFGGPRNKKGSRNHVRGLSAQRQDHKRSEGLPGKLLEKEGKGSREQNTCLYHPSPVPNIVEVITVADLKKVYKTTFEARYKWKNIFLELDLSSDTIESIGVSCHNNPVDCYREGLMRWLKSGERSWRDLAEALSSPTVDHQDIALVIEREYFPESAIVASAADNENPDMASSPNRKVNENLKIFVKEKLGTGAFGVVFKGSYKSSPCAVKLLHEVAMEIQTNLPTAQENKISVSTFDRECKFLESLQHPNIVQHLTTDKYPPISGSTILVTELMDCSLRFYLSGIDKVTSRCQVSLSKDVASGLAYIHSKQIIHRDLCGDNILLTLSQPVPVAKISDFGMSRLLNPSQMSSTLTAVGHRMGYLPSEALRLKEEIYDQSLDVFSLGVIIMQIVCKAGSVKTVKDRCSLIKQIPSTHRLKVIISYCLQEDMESRPTAKAVCALLKREIEIQGDLLQELRPPLSLNWRRGEDMQQKISGIGSVVIGNTVYFCGVAVDEYFGFVDGLKYNYESTVMKLNLYQDKWTRLPQISFNYFAMTSLNTQLVLVGGTDIVSRKVSGQIAVFESNEWIHPFPPMNIARGGSTAVCLDNHIIVAGGFDDQYRCLSSVEVLDVVSKVWYHASPLPNALSGMNSTVIGNTLFLVGGFDGIRLSKMVHKVNLIELIANAISLKQATPTLWQLIEESPLENSAPLSVKGSLLAVGGHQDHFKSSSSIFLYQADGKRWIKVGDLPTARYSCTCSVLPIGEVIVAGGLSEPQVFLTSVNFLLLVPL